MEDKDTYVIIGGGPSLTQEQVEYICEHGHHAWTIAVNDAYKLAPWADFVFAADVKWWRLHYDDVCNTVAPYTELRTIQNVVDPFFKNRPITRPIYWDYVFRKVDYIDVNPMELYHGGCSGILAMDLARTLGEVHSPKKIILVGFDMQHTGGKSHWFGDHPEGFLNANACERWCEEIGNMMPYYRQWDIEVVNCSIETAIHPNIVRRSTLEEEL